MLFAAFCCVGLQTSYSEMYTLQCTVFGLDVIRLCLRLQINHSLIGPIALDCKTLQMIEYLDINLFLCFILTTLIHFIINSTFININIHSLTLIWCSVKSFRFILKGHFILYNKINNQYIQNTDKQSRLKCFSKYLTVCKSQFSMLLADVSISMCVAL